MNILTRIVKSIFKSYDASSEGSGQFYPLTNTSYNVSALSRSDYLRLYISRQYVAISTIANTIGGLKYKLSSGQGSDKEIIHPHLKLVNYDLLVAIISSLQLTGSCYLYKNMIGKTIDSLDHFRTDLVTIEENADGSIKGYRYNNKNKNYLFQPNEIIDISLFSPLKTYPYTVKGVSPMQAIAIQAEMDSTANRWNRNFFKNGGSVRDILSTDQLITQEQKERAASKWRQEFQGVNNAHKVAVLDSGLKYNNVGTSQKEMDFVESRRFTRDEILAIFKVPKSIIGLSEDSNRASATVALETYYRICIQPLVSMIEGIFNKELFYGKGIFSFIDILREDVDIISKDLESGAITINEYRTMRGYKTIDGGDVLKQGMYGISDPVKVTGKAIDNGLHNSIKTILNKNTKGTPEYKKIREEQGQAKREKKVKRTDKFEIKYIQEINNIFDSQSREYVSQLMNKKTVSINKIINTTKWVVALTPLYKDIFQSEGNEALDEIGISTIFQSGSNTINKWIKDNIRKVATDVDSVTKEKVFSIIEQGNRDGIGAEAIARNISNQFEEFTRTRSRTIARTEVTRASTQAEIEAYKSSGLVEGKEWYTSTDERVCEYCGPMNGKTVGLNQPYFKKGEEFNGLKLDYADVDGPSLHPNCRCTILPVLR